MGTVDWVPRKNILEEVMSEQITGQAQPGSSDELATVPKPRPLPGFRNHMTNPCVSSRSSVQGTDYHQGLHCSVFAFLCETWYQRLLLFQRLCS